MHPLALPAASSSVYFISCSSPRHPHGCLLRRIALPSSSTFCSSCRSSPWIVALLVRAKEKTMLSSSAQFPNSSPSEDVLRIWRSAEAVCFDVDSTVCMDEGIDELATFCGAGEVVAAWTSSAMSGSVTFEEALNARLALFKPSYSDVKSFLASNPPKITPGIKDLVQKLQIRNTDVYLVSGGFRQMIAPIATVLEIPEEKIFANKLLFDNKGHFLGFDVDEPTSRSGGKATAISLIKQIHGYKMLVMVGDGATDLEARRPGGADMFICYGGVQCRPTIAAEADWFVTSFNDLVNSLDEADTGISFIT